MCESKNRIRVVNCLEDKIGLKDAFKMCLWREEWVLGENRKFNKDVLYKLGIGQPQRWLANHPYN